MDGMPGLIPSADDFVINTAGIAITETRRANFYGFDTNGVAKFSSNARKAMQYAESIRRFCAHYEGR